MTQHAPPPPPPPPRTNYVMYGLLGVFVGLAIVVAILLLNSGDDTVATTSTSGGSAADTLASTTIAPSTTEAAATTAAEASTTTAATTTSQAAFPGDTTNKVADGAPFATFAFLSDIRFAQREEGFTRIVFDFEGDEIPWWAVGYAPGPFTNIGDEPVPVAGGAYLKVDLASTSYDLTGEEVRFTYEGPDRVPVDTTSVVEVVRLEDFEGVSSWVIGVISERPFVVGTLNDPPRVYVDIQD